jgi:hypothetical protein
MNGRMSKEARALELARFAICDFHDEVGKVSKAIAKLSEAGLAEAHHIALGGLLSKMDRELEAWHRVESVSVADFNQKVVRS